MITLRPYQQQAVNALRAAYRAGHQGLLLRLPTGGGKTIVFTKIAQGAERRGKRVLIVAHRDELLTQCSSKLYELGVGHGIVSGGRTSHGLLPVQVGMIQTLARRLKADRYLPPPPDLVIIDEAHLAGAQSYEDLCLTHYPKALRLLVTATPWRLDRKGFTHLATHMVEGPDTADMIAQGYLVPPVLFSANNQASNLVAELRTKGDSDFTERQLDALVNRTELNGDIVTHYTRHALGRKGIVFAVGVPHAVALAEAFRAEGYTATHVDGQMAPGEREGRLLAHKLGQVQILVNCGVLCEGYDDPTVSAVVLARPTQSLSLYLQQAGRGLRLAPGKNDCIILDHAGNALRFGPIEERRQWSLQARPKDDARERKPVAERPEVKLCLACHNEAPWAAPVCLFCGWPFRVQREVVENNAELIHWQSLAPEVKLQCEFERLKREGKARGYKYANGWAWHRMEDSYPRADLVAALGVRAMPYTVRREWEADPLPPGLVDGVRQVEVSQ